MAEEGRDPSSCNTNPTFMREKLTETGKSSAINPMMMQAVIRSFYD
jgi:hypothetical protein